MSFMIRFRRVGLFIVAIGLACVGTTQAQQEVPLWEKAPADGKPAHAEAVQDKHETGRLDRWISYVSEPTLTVYPASATKAAGPAVLVIPGGGYWYVCIDKEGIEPARWLNSIGLTAVVLKYRTLDPAVERTPQTIEPLFTDPVRAMRVVRHHAAEWHIDPQRIGVMGFSAGAAMAMRLTTAVPATADADAIDQMNYRPDFVAIVYGGLPPNMGVALKPLPPFFVVHAADDPKVPVSITARVSKYVQEGAGAVELHVFRRGGHGFGVLPPAGPVHAWTDLFAAWARDLGMAP
jgi:acetyl esterase/lipase